MNVNRIAILIKKASLEFDQISNPILSEYDLTTSQFRVLKFLYSQKDEISRVADIEKQCSIRHPTVIGLLDNLEKKGFVFKKINPNDARSKQVVLTKKAKDMQSEIEGVGDRIEDILTKNLSESEKKQLLKLLKKLLKIESSGDKNV